MMHLLCKILTFWIPGKRMRKRARWALLNLWYGRNVYKNALRVGKGIVVRGQALINKATSIGDNVVINGGFAISGEGRVEIGDCVQIAPDVLILTSNHDYNGDDYIPYGHRSICKPVRIRNYVWIGQRATLLPGTIIGEGAIIQAGAVVHGAIPPCAIAGGNPAKVFASRDIDHFECLKKEGRQWSVFNVKER